MQAKRRVHPPVLARAIAVEESPSRYWGLALIAASTASWAVIFGLAKLLLAVI